MITKRPIFSGLLIMALIAGCSSNDPAQATAEAIVISGVAKSAENEQMLEMFKKQPEFKTMVSCFAQSLENQGWSSSDHDTYMEATGGTGDFRMIDNRKYSETEAMEKFGAIAVATSECM